MKNTSYRTENIKKASQALAEKWKEPGFRDKQIEHLKKIGRKSALQRKGMAERIKELESKLEEQA